jgi:pimeloyl-ACP methyl ester carboxylesterase
LVHGSVVTRKMWLPQLRGLSDAYRVIAPDLPGHGDLAAVPFTFDGAADRVAEVIRHEAGGGRAVVVGLSLGGYVAIALAARHPDLVNGLVLSGCSLNFTGVLGVYLRIIRSLMRRGWLRQSPAQAARKTRRLFSPELADVADSQLKAGVYPDALAPAFTAMAGTDFSAMLSRYPGPVLILNGERDRASRRREQEFAAAAGDARVAIVHGAGHACSLDQPNAYNQAVREFARSSGR